MAQKNLDTKAVEKASVEELFQTLGSGKEGLSIQEVEKRQKEYGVNEITEKQVSPLVKFLLNFWGPIPWMIEVAAILSAAVKHWTDLTIILIMLFFNAGIEFYQEFQAGNAIEQLKKGLALKAKVLRDGEWKEVEARELVPGDVIRLRLGDVVPADVKLVEGDYLSIDQAALTGESLPVAKKVGAVAYSSSIVKQGEMVGLVTGTGMNTYFGKTAQLVSTAKNVSHFQKAVLEIGDFLIYVCIALVGVIIIMG
ncbi:MAG: metal-transporting ATPase, partial [Deltaproteobacteria bacterium]